MAICNDAKWGEYRFVGGKKGDKFVLQSPTDDTRPMKHRETFFNISANAFDYAWESSHDNGFGTDAAAGMVDTILYEFTMRSKFFTPLEMLKQATSTNAELLRTCNSRDPYKAAPLGVVKDGAWADMLIYSANPLEDIKVVTEPEKSLKFIMKGGKVYKNELGK